MSSTRTGPETISLLTPRVEPGSSVSARSGQRRPVVVMPTAGPPSAISVSTAPGRARERHALAGVDGHGARAPMRASRRKRSEARRRQQHELGEVVIEARAAAAADDRDARRAEREGVVERELEIGRLLVDRVALDAHARASAARTAGAVAESRSPTSTSTVRPSAAAWSRPESAAITNAPAGSGPTSRGVGREAAAHHQGAAATARLRGDSTRRVCQDRAVRVVTLGDLLLDVVVRLEAPPASDDDVPAAIALVPGGQAANVAAWVALARRARRAWSRAAPTTPAAAWSPASWSGAASSWPGRWSPASARAPWSPSSRPTARARSRATAARRATLGPDDVDESMVAGADVLHVAGYTLLRAPGAEAALRLAEAARRYGARVTVDLSTAHGIAAARTRGDAQRAWPRSRPTSCSPTRPRPRRSASRSARCGSSSAAPSDARSEQGGERRRARRHRGRRRGRHHRRGRRLRGGLPARARPAARGAARAGRRGPLRHAASGRCRERAAARRPRGRRRARARGAGRVPRDDARRPRLPGGRGLRGRCRVRGRRARRRRRARDGRHPRRRAGRRPERGRAAALRRGRRRRAQGRRARPRGLLRAGCARRHDRRRHARRRAPARHRGDGDGRPRRRPSRVPAPAGRLVRPRRARAHARGRSSPAASSRCSTCPRRASCWRRSAFPVLGYRTRHAAALLRGRRRPAGLGARRVGRRGGRGRAGALGARRERCGRARTAAASRASTTSSR